MSATVSTGHWRPVQGAFQLCAFYIGLRGLIAGPVPGQAVSTLTNNSHSLSVYIFFGSLFLGGLVSIAGEAIQITYPLNKAERIDRFLDGLTIEAAGDFLISLNIFASAVAVAYSGNPIERAIIYVFFGIGFLGRAGQAVLDIYRIRRTIHEVGLHE